jgi:serine/threonine-protein kinase
MPLAAGTRLGPYEIRAPIGAGGMGEVYRAHDGKLGRDVAIKVLPEELASDEERVARFEREAKLLASLNHPNIAAIYGFEGSHQPERSAKRSGVAEREVVGVGPHDTEICALVLELVEGPTLAERIREGPIPLEEALAMARQIADALEAGHESGVIHRDLKPANVKLREDGTVKVLDYGLAKALERGASEAADPKLSMSPTLTRQGTQIGVILGTAAYMSPEQAKGRRLDKRTDIWSFGVVLFEMFTGKRAFAGEDVSDTLAFVLTREPDWSALPPGVPPSLRTYLMRCLEKDPRRRVRDIGDVRLALDGAFDVASASAPAAPAVTTRSKLPWVATVVASLATGLAVFGLMRSEPAEVTRFAYELPAGHQLRNQNRAVLAASPDGRRFVYNTTDGVYLRSLDELDARLLSGTEASLNVLFFSADGRSIGYQQNGQWKRLSLSGGAPVVVGSAEVPNGAHWAADDRIYFATPEGILRVPANGGTPEVVVKAVDGELFDSPQLLPGGDTLLFSAIPDGGTSWDEARIEAASLDSGDRTVLLEGGSDARYLSSGHLVYALEDGLFAVAFDARSLRVTSGPVSVVEGVDRANTTASANYAVSDDGTLFFLAAGAKANHRLSWVDRTGRAEIIETIPPNDYDSPRLSPDGERVVVAADGDVRIYDLASGREIRLTTDRRTRPYADWTPSGLEVAYSAGSPNDNIWIQPADGSGKARPLTALEGSIHFDAWAPDGRTFSAHQHGIRNGDGSRQLMVHLDGEEAKPETWLERDFAITNAVFSPDGGYVALISSQTGQQEIYILPFPGPGAQTPVSVGGGREPAWGRSGEIFYRRPDDYMMMAVEVSTDPVLTVGPPRELFPGNRDPGGSPRARYAVTADGERFLMSAGLLASGEGGPGPRPRVVIVQNWVEELKERVPVR